jgi:hypothetical protein
LVRTGGATPLPPLDWSSPIKVRQVKEDKVIELSTRSDEAAQAQIERFIERRDEKRRQSEGERLEQELWMKTVKAYNERERRQIRAQWYGWHCDQVERHRRTLAALIAHHEGEAQRLLEPEEMDQAEGGP